MGEGNHKLNEVAISVKQALGSPYRGDESMSVLTPGGRIQVGWDERSNATAMGQLPFFAEFLEVEVPRKLLVIIGCIIAASEWYQLFDRECHQN